MRAECASLYLHITPAVSGPISGPYPNGKPTSTLSYPYPKLPLSYTIPYPYNTLPYPTLPYPYPTLPIPYPTYTRHTHALLILDQRVSQHLSAVVLPVLEIYKWAPARAHALTETPDDLCKPPV